MVITIDGLCENGKTTLALRIARTLGFKCFNTGAIYRCYALYMKENHIVDHFSELKHLNISFDNKNVLLNDIDVTDKIYTPEISLYSTEIASISEIKDIVNQYQKNFINQYDTVMEGRDIGTRIAPNADIKFYLYASDIVRANRIQKSKNISFDEALKNIKQLDDMDINDGLFVKPENSIEIDTSNLDIEEVYNLMMDKIKEIIN